MSDIHPAFGTLDAILANCDVVEKSGCWEWKGYRNQYGYGVVRGTNIYAIMHRSAWELANGPISDGLNICHHCDNPPCCNPEHLWSGTQKENLQDMYEKDRSYYGSRTHCERGHPLSGDNLRVYTGPDNQTTRRCIACIRENNKVRLEKVH